MINLSVSTVVLATGLASSVLAGEIRTSLVGYDVQPKDVTISMSATDVLLTQQNNSWSFKLDATSPVVFPIAIEAAMPTGIQPFNPRYGRLTPGMPYKRPFPYLS